MHGLYQQRESVIRSIERLTDDLAANASNPSAVHQINRSITDAKDQQRGLTLEISACATAIADIRSIIAALGKTRPSSNKTLAMRHLEDAESRLLRELGDPVD